MRGVKTLLIVSAAVLMLAGCGAREEQLSENPAAPGVENTTTDNQSGAEEPATEEQPEDAESGEQGQDGEQPNDNDAEAVPQERTIKVFRTDDQLMELHESEETISYTNDQELLEAALAKLQEDGDDGQMSLWKPIQINKATVEDGNVVLDLTIPDEARYGSGGEMFTIDSITKTVFQFEAFETLDLLVDGEQAESLMGHVTLEHPFVKSP